MRVTGTYGAGVNQVNSYPHLSFHARLGSTVWYAGCHDGETGANINICFGSSFKRHTCNKILWAGRRPVDWQWNGHVFEAVKRGGGIGFVGEMGLWDGTRMSATEMVWTGGMLDG